MILGLGPLVSGPYHRMTVKEFITDVFGNGSQESHSKLPVVTWEVSLLCKGLLLGIFSLKSPHPTLRHCFSLFSEVHSRMSEGLSQELTED